MRACTYLVLGPILVRTADGVTTTVGGPVTRAVLAGLLIGANHAISQEVLIDAVWEEDRPHDPEHSLHSQITRLRRILGAEAITRDGHAYALNTRADDIDARRFERLTAAAIDATDPAEIRETCLEALALWRGGPFGELGDREFLQLESRRLEEIRLNTIERCFDADLRLGRHHEIVASLRAAVTQYPFRETLWRHLVLALDRSGRQPEALRAYDEYDGFLRDELGIAPGIEMQDLRNGIVASRAPRQPTA